MFVSVKVAKDISNVKNDSDIEDNSDVKKELKYKKFKNRNELCKYVNENEIEIESISSQSRGWNQVNGDGYVFHTLWYYGKI